MPHLNRNAHGIEWRGKPFPQCDRSTCAAWHLYMCLIQGVLFSKTPIGSLEPVQIFCIVEHIACLNSWRHSGLCQENKAGKMPTSKRKMDGKRWKQPKIIDKQATAVRSWRVRVFLDVNIPTLGICACTSLYKCMVLLCIRVCFSSYKCTRFVVQAC